MDTSYQIKRTLKKIKSGYLSENIHGHFPLDKENIEEKKELLFIRKHTWTLPIR